MCLRPCVHQHIARPCVEAEGGCVGGEYTDVGNPADVQHHACFFVVSEQGFVKGGDERRTLSAGCKVAAAEVADGKNLSQFRQQRQIGKLYAVTVFRCMSDGLTVAADSGNVVRREVLTAQQFGDGLRIQAAEFLRQNPAAVQFVCACVLQIQQFAAQPVRVGYKGVSLRAQPFPAVHTYQYGIRPVHTCSRHDADVKLCFHHHSQTGAKRHFNVY